MSVSPRVSVVLPTHGRRTSLLRVLHALSHQSIGVSAFEVIVICDGDVDGSVATCRAFASQALYRLRVFEQSNQGPAVARNCGVAAACAPLIVFIDDDVVPDKNLIATHVAAHEGQDMCVAMGPLLPPSDFRLNPWGTWEERVLCRQYGDMTRGRWSPTYRQFYTGNASVLKKHVVEAGGFDPSYRRAEDVELALRLHDHGLHFVFLPEARGWHYVQRTLASWLKMPFAYGAADVAMARGGRPWRLTMLAREFHTRNRAVRILTLLCVGRPWAMRIVLGLLKSILAVVYVAGATPAAYPVCGFIFNLCYYHGFATALGGRPAFIALLSGHSDVMPLSPPDHTALETG